MKQGDHLHNVLIFLHSHQSSCGNSLNGRFSDGSSF
jgi:hypothetical protein